ncbi:biotin--[acetyl-CoA-carboxylase] ligase [Parasphingorhabdus halotolerans]|uniref:biotin--[biotin carboxyl-carrier protein] ligase n=1 Tax=Parasphingorhabdus halotolerans TaxID=2725558 RepID=A0A6H2DI77_9SPHN|nr:biotin--[acetyl-CoA-carboxylase] ligase [Parasphingorhabdus halotolerans]QJB68090.1 biotin--[acetyl-CoA-carboxylase] ligase [Parasphingorhabdus halotolerans]
MKQLAANGLAEGFWLRAEKQTGGKGRLGRKWESPEGNLYCSTLVHTKPDDPPATSLSFVSSLAVFDAIKICLPDAELELKWPNDILLTGHKLCGILLERSENRVIIGIGVNVAVVPEVEGRVVTSLHQAGVNSALTAADFLELLAARFAHRLETWRSAGLRKTLDNWEKLAHGIGSPLSVTIDKDNRIEGQYAGLSDAGALRLRKPDGTLIDIHAGDVEAG